MMTQVCVHYANEVPAGMRDSIDVGRAESQFGCARPQQDLVGAVNLHQFLRHILRSVRTSIVNNDDFVI